MLFKIFLVAFAIFAIVRTHGQYMKRQVSKYWFIAWTGLWAVVVFVALAPEATDILARVAGVERGADLLVYTAIVVLSYAVYRLMVRQQKLNEEITDLVRTIAIERVDKGETR
ncbi:MAG: DUF2304 domain-containing protein [Candidatus Uhrbacteria bacterium]|nr:DUF2304 domain-containing protein [Candidatus Uhrbacteria bacterium]